MALTNESGGVTDRVEYGPYGAVTEREGDTWTLFLFVGRYGVQTDANGLYYMRARYYSPELGRLVNEDPYWHPGNMIYGSDSAKKANGVRTPDIFAIMQSNNLYAMNNPVIWFSHYEVSDEKTI